MLQSPAKRRKLSEYTSIATEPRNANQTNAANPTTPTRASYQSPTKASLARSHPHLVTRSAGASLGEPKGRVLRNELLGVRDAERNGDAVSGEAIQQTLSGNAIQNSANMSEYRPPLQPRQPSAIATQASEKDDDEQPVQTIVPRLVRRDGTTQRATSRPRSTEPDLPPTPVQLGINPAPERPRGLTSSSSPRGSKSGSGRNRRRVRDGDAVTSSPLKPKAKAPVLQIKPAERAEEAPESEANDSEPEPEVSEEITEKQTLLEGLRSELEALKAEALKLEAALEVADDATTSQSDMELLSLLKADSISSKPDPQISVGSEEDALQFLTLFSPANLQVSVKTSSNSINGRPKMIHTINISAPPPWPPHVFNAQFEVVADAEDAWIENIIQSNLTNGNRSALGQGQLQVWISKRLQSPLHQLDVGSLIWSTGKYFDECVKRARILRRLDMEYNSSSNATTKEIGLKDDLTHDQALALSHYLELSHMEFHTQHPTGVTGKQRMDAAKIILQWQFEINWTGAIKSKIEIAASGMSVSSQQWIKEVFERSLKQSGLLLAFSNMWDLIAKNPSYEPEDIGEGAQSRRKDQKRKRI